MKSHAPTNCPVFPARIWTAMQTRKCLPKEHAGDTSERRVGRVLYLLILYTRRFLPGAESHLWKWSKEKDLRKEELSWCAYTTMGELHALVDEDVRFFKTDVKSWNILLTKLKGSILETK